MVQKGQALSRTLKEKLEEIKKYAIAYSTSTQLFPQMTWIEQLKVGCN